MEKEEKIFYRGHVTYPTRDVDRRRVLGLILNLSKSAVRRFSCEELEEIALKRGLLKKGWKDMNIPGLIKVASDGWLKLHAKKDALDDILEWI